HIEAGLRTGNDRDPFPEEANRRLIDHLAQLHFAPTPHAAANLRREGLCDSTIAVTGNTIVDAVQAAASADIAAILPDLRAARQIVTVTCHRRENWGARLLSICTAIRALIAATPELVVVFALHGNRALATRIRAALDGTPRLHLLAPLPFAHFLALLKASALVLTDSGGVQEEAISLQRPVLVCRDASERPEGTDTGLMRIVGTNAATLAAAAGEWLSQAPVGDTVNPFGDGRASARIAEALARWSSGHTPLLAPERQFQGAAMVPA
ncbi:MAG: UDP-N-acetylglucosamine 2-epimerase (non-hydrolyzing), partial [Alphaproteobacteria bacterium]